MGDTGRLGSFPNKLSILIFVVSMTEENGNYGEGRVLATINRPKK